MATSARSEAPLLDVRDVDAWYDGPPVLSGLALSVGRSEIVALSGTRGAGKTTVLRAICGTVSTRGSLQFAGCPLPRSAPDAVARLGIAHVTEERGTLAALTVRENLALAGSLVSRRRASERYRRVIAYVPWLADRARVQAGSLSGGERQMLAIGRALMADPMLVLLDEPLLGLSEQLSRDVVAILRDANERDGVALLVAQRHGAAFGATHTYALPS
jgi:branched-chain amino acid transport system ATP-binding protein